MVKNDDTCYKIAEFALQSILYEAACFDKPGLVSPVSNGAHSDMDYFTFIDSTCSISKALKLCAEAGFSSDSPKEIFKNIRQIGIQGEKDMLTKTRGVNTHKGMLFLIGISCAAVSKCIYEKKNFICIEDIIKEMTEGIVEKELVRKVPNNEKNVSHGEKMFLIYGCKGIRGEIEEGLPIIFKNSLRYYEKNKELPQNDKLLQTLLYIMKLNEDTNILYRHSKEVLEEVKEKAACVLEAGGLYTSEGINLLNKMNYDFIERRISPGGSADLLAATVFFNLAKEYMAAIF